MRKKFRRAVFVVTYSRGLKGKGIEYLILKRKLHWKGWEFPKGGLTGIKERILEKSAVKREVIEETGLTPIKIRKFKVSGKYKYKKELKDRPGIIGQKYQLYSAEVKKNKPDIKKNKEKEHSDFLWADYKTVLKKLTWPNQKKCLKIVNNYLSKKFK
jgi:8-oxo-dGTP pyrophosphatase MutT (NUDIX family)